MKIDVNYVCKLKTLQWSDSQIATRLGCTETEVAEAWDRAVGIARDVAATGYADFQQQFLILTRQYQLLGSSLKAIGNGIGNFMSRDEVVQVVLSALSTGEDKNIIDVDRLVTTLLANCIMLKPFVAIDPEKDLDDLEKTKNN